MRFSRFEKSYSIASYISRNKTVHLELLCELLLGKTVFASQFREDIF